MKTINKIDLNGIKYELRDINAQTHILDKNNPHEVGFYDLPEIDNAIASNNQVLSYDSTKNKWTPKSINMPEVRPVQLNATGTGNAITSMAVSDNTITYLLGKTFIESETKLSKDEIVDNPIISGDYVVTSIDVEDHKLIVKKQKISLSSGNRTIEKFAPENYTENVDYSIGDFVIYNETLYECKENFQANTFNDDLNNGRIEKAVGLGITKTQLDALIDSKVETVKTLLSNSKESISNKKNIISEFNSETCYPSCEAILKYGAKHLAIFKEQDITFEDINLINNTYLYQYKEDYIKCLSARDIGDESAQSYMFLLECNFNGNKYYYLSHECNALKLYVNIDSTEPGWYNEEGNKINAPSFVINNENNNLTECLQFSDFIFLPDRLTEIESILNTNGTGEKILTDNGKYIRMPNYDSQLFETEIVSDEILFKNENYKVTDAIGSISTNSTYWNLSDYINVSNGATLTGYNTESAPGILLYDKDKNLKQTIIGTTAVTSSDSIFKSEISFNENEYAYAQVQSDIYFDNTHASAIVNKTALQIIDDIKNNAKFGVPGQTEYFKIQVNKEFSQYSIDNDSNELLDSETLVDINCAVRFPESYTRYGEPCDLVICMHGKDGSVDETMATELDLYSNKLLEGGYVIADCNGIVEGNHYGSPIAVQSYTKLIDYITEKYNVRQNVFISAHCTGALAALNLVNHYSNKIRAVSLLYPFVSLKDQIWDNDETIRDKIAKVYNFNDLSGGTWEPDKIVGFDPLSNKTFINSDIKYTLFPVPLKIWHGTADTVVTKDLSETLVQQIKNAGGNAEIRIVDAFDHGYSDNVKLEELYWFNRF